MGCNWGLTPSKYSVVGVPSQYAPSPTVSFHIFPFIWKKLVSLGQTMPSGMQAQAHGSDAASLTCGHKETLRISHMRFHTPRQPGPGEASR